MNAATAVARLGTLGLPVIRTGEAAAVLGVTTEAASKMLQRLGKVGLVQPVRHGLVWIAPGPIDPLVLLEYLTAPYPAYVSLYSALYLRGVLSQIPEITYAVSLARAQRIRTGVGTFSVHHVSPELFQGFETLASGAKLATTEKALFDLAALSVTRDRTIGRPAELTLPRSLDRPALRRWVGMLQTIARRKAVTARLAAWGVLPSPSRRRRGEGD